jgi:putative redox protein
MTNATPSPPADNPGARGVIRLRLEDGLNFTATTPRGHRVRLSSSADGEANREAPTPMEMVLIALAACSGMDVISVLRKMRQEPVGYDIEIAGQRAADYPRVYTTVEMRHELRGDVSDAAARRAISLSMEKYCPVFAMLSPGVAITEHYSVVDDAGGQARHRRTLRLGDDGLVADAADSG